MEQGNSRTAFVDRIRGERMMSRNLMPLPVCPTCAEHGEMILRPIEVQTYEQKYCGTWYDCTYPGCHSSVLLPSKELKEQYKKLNEQYKKLVDDCGIVVGYIKKKNTGLSKLSKATYEKYCNNINTTNSVNVLWEIAQELELNNRTLAKISSLCFDLKRRMDKKKLKRVKTLLLKYINKKGGNMDD